MSQATAALEFRWMSGELSLIESDSDCSVIFQLLSSLVWKHIQLHE